MSQEKKVEMEKKALELEQLRKEFRDLSGLFDLKTTENEKLKEDLSDTINQLEEKSVMLQKTQEEKEVQEHLVSRHILTEDKIKGQAFELREVADQQYSDLDKLHESKERKGKLEAMNKKTTSEFHVSSADGFGRMDKITAERSEIQAKLCSVVKTSQDEVVKKNEEFTQKSVEELANANGEIKDIMTKIDGLAADHMHAEQAFVSSALSKAQNKMNLHSSSLQNHLKKTLSETQDLDTATTQQEKAFDTMVSSFKQHISMDDSLVSTFKHFLEELLEATDKKQGDSFAKSKRFTNDNYDQIQAFKEQIESEKKKMEAEMSELSSQIANKRDAYSSIFANFDEKLDVIKSNVREVQKEAEDSTNLVSSAHNTLVQRSQAMLEEKSELSGRVLSSVAHSSDDVSSTLKSLVSGVERIRENEKSFVGESQEEGRLAYADMEQEFRVKSDGAPKQMQMLQENTRAVQKLSSESVSAHESASESHQSRLVRWRDEFSSDFDGICEQIENFDSKIKHEISESRTKGKKFFSQDLKDDQPTGKTPGRIARSYPKEIVEGTPDETRVRRFRQSRDLGAAMKLRIEDLEDNDDMNEENDNEMGENDSVFSASTIMTESDGGVLAGNSKNVSRQNSANDMSTVANTSGGSEEVGYVSDLENKAPSSVSSVESSKFVVPGSKLKMPKSYPSSTSTSTSNINSRSRSSSRSRARNVLGSAN